MMSWGGAFDTYNNTTLLQNFNNYMHTSTNGSVRYVLEYRYVCTCVRSTFGLGGW